MRIIDLTHPISQGMGMYPGTPPVRVEAIATIWENRFRESMFHFPSHTGTHVDAPAHMLPERLTLDKYPAQAFAGKAITVDCRPYLDCGDKVPANVLDGYMQLIGGVDFVFFYTGHDALFGGDGYYAGWPGLDVGLADRIAEAGIVGIGVDTPSPDASGDTGMGCHLSLMRAGKLIYENLANLELTLGGVFDVAALPLPVKDADGSPVRAVAML